MSNSEKPQKSKFKLHKRFISKRSIFITASIMLTVLLIGALVYYFIGYKKNSEDISLSNNLNSSQEVAARKKIVDDVKEEADAMLQEKIKENGSAQISDEDLAEIDKVFEDAINSSSDGTTKGELIYNNAIVYFNAGMHDEALSMAAKAEENYEDEGIVHFIATIYEIKGDKQNAILYYRKAADLVVEAEDYQLYSIDYYENKIKELQN